jgi:hypothetical protein
MFARTNLHKTSPITLLTINAIGAVGYVLLASRAWVIPQECEAGINTTTGEPLVWFSSIAPIITIFFLFNAVWGMVVLKHKQWAAGRMWLGSAALWLIAAFIDFSHHQC